MIIKTLLYEIKVLIILGLLHNNEVQALTEYEAPKVGTVSTTIH